MKKGFTLIELLAVILILGIIALIAIPTVNNIISEARYGAFKSGNENIMKTIQQDCQTSIMKGETPILSYLFTEGKSSNEINIKGSLPNDGYIFLNRSCEITDYYLTDNKNVYLNGNDVREDYMLMKAENGQSIFKDLYASHYENILNVIIINNLVIPENAIGVTDISLSKNGKIKSWLIPNGNNYDLYIGSEGTIYANYNSRYLFADLTNVMNINVEKINTNFVTNAEKMFYNCLNIEEINMSNFITDNMQNINSIFANCKKIKNIDVSKWNTSNIKFFTYTFLFCEKVKTLDVLNWDLSSAIEIGGLFQCCYSLRSVDLTNWNISNVTVINSLFNSCYALNYIGNISNWDTSNVISMRYLFQSCGDIKEINLSN